MENWFRFSVDDLEKAITPRTRYILICTPNNPSGAVVTREDLEVIADIAFKHDIWVISDETYEKFLYDCEHVSIASLPGMFERTVTIGAASKTWSMTGWRVGWAICPEVMKPYFNKCHQNMTTCATSFAQAGVLEAFNHADSNIRDMVSEYKRRRDMIVKKLSEIDGFEVFMPSGAFYIFPRITKLGMDGMSFCSWLLENSGVASVPGELFGMPGHIRFAYCRSYDYILDGINSIKDAVKKYKFC